MTSRSSRLTRFLQGITLATAGVFFLTSVTKAQTPGAPAPTPPVPNVEDLGGKQKLNAEKFQQFKEGLFRLASRLEKSDRAEDKATAKTIMEAIDLATKSGVDNQFQKLVLGLKNTNLTSGEGVKLQNEEEQLRKMLNEILAILMTDDEHSRLKAEIKRLEELHKEITDIKNAQERHQDQVQSNAGDKDKLAKLEKELKERTESVANKMDGKDPKAGDKNNGGKPNETKKDDRADNKSEPKAGDKGGEAKPETGEEKGAPKDSDPKDPMKGGEGAEPKDAGKGDKPMDGMGQPKDPKEGAGEAKGSGEPKDSKDPMGMGKDPMGMGKDPMGMGKDPMGMGKDPMGNPMGNPKDPMGGGKDPAAGKPSEGKGEGKGQGQGKGEGKPGEGKGQGGEGKGQGGKPGEGGKGGEAKPGGQPGQPGEPGQGGGKPPPGGQPPKNTPGRKEVQDAIPQQDGAAKDLEKNDRPAAGKKEDKAVEALAKALDELEKRLKQLREEEAKKLLANVEARVGKMLEMQIAVRNATVAIDDAVKKNNGVQTVADKQKSQQQGDKEGEIVIEADRALKLLESEGSAVAFARVLEEVRQDMIAVQRRLAQSVVNEDTQQIEQSIIDMLKEMKDALKKAQQKPDPSEPKDGKPGDPPKPPNKALIDLIAELKLIRSMQMQVNKRTELHGKKDPQAADNLIQAELRQLSARQAKLQDMIEKIASGNNQ